MDKQKMVEWVGTHDTGVSSMTMWCALMGVDRSSDIDVPHDNSDFERCYDLVTFCGVTQDELVVVKKKYPWFAPFVDHWNKLVELKSTASMLVLYDKIRELHDDSDRIRYNE